MNSRTSSTELNDMLTNFVKYVDSFYGVNDGDSLDRERVRDILLEEYNYKFVGE